MIQFKVHDRISAGPGEYTIVGVYIAGLNGGPDVVGLKPVHVRLPAHPIGPGRIHEMYVPRDVLEAAVLDGSATLLRPVSLALDTETPEVPE